MKDHAEEAERLALYACDGPPEHALPAIRRLRSLIEVWESRQVAAARASGWNWGEIGRVLGRSRQAVHARYRVDRAEATADRPPMLSRAERDVLAQRLMEQKLTGVITAEEWLRRIDELDDQVR
jgi:hypothetical protein